MVNEAEQADETEEEPRTISESNTKAEILEYTRDLEDRLAQAQLDNEAEVERTDVVSMELGHFQGRPAATMPDKIAVWLKVSLGKDIDPETIMVQDLTATSVIYRFKGEKDIFGIPLTSTGALKDPPVHEHSWVRRGGPGGAEQCLCGKRLSPDGYAMSVEEQRAMAQAESAKATSVAENEESAQLEDTNPELNE